MVSTIQLKRSSTTGHTPSSLAAGEPAINEADGLLFFRDSGGAVKAKPIWGSSIVTITDAASTSFDAQKGLTNIARLTAAGDRTITAPSNPLDGQKIIIEHTASGANRTLTLSTSGAGSFDYGTDVTALTATTSGATDVIGVIYNLAADRWRVVAAVKGF